MPTHPNATTDSRSGTALADALKGQLPADECRQIATIPERYVNRALADDWTAVAQLYHREALQLLPDAPPVEGRAAIGAALARQLGAEGGVRLTAFSVAIAEAELLPDQGERDPLAPQLAMHRRPVRLRKAAARPAARGREQQAFEIGLAHALGQRPGQPGPLDALEILPDGRLTDRQARRNLPGRQPGRLHPKGFLDLPHRQSSHPGFPAPARQTQG